MTELGRSKRRLRMAFSVCWIPRFSKHGPRPER